MMDGVSLYTGDEGVGGLFGTWNMYEFYLKKVIYDFASEAFVCSR